MEYYILGLVVVFNIITLFVSVKALKNRGPQGVSEEFKMQLQSFKDTREILLDTIKRYNENVNMLMNSQTDMQSRSFATMLLSIEKLTAQDNEKLEKVGLILEKQITSLQQDNSKKLEEMRVTVDEKLNQNLERRLNQSFSLISERLEAVHKGLGEMQQLANGVGDLKKVLTNIKTRGTWGEVQLNMLLEQMLAPNQYIQSAQVRKNSQERADFAVIMPGTNDQNILLPIDAKFPIEDYQRLCDLQDPIEIEKCKKAIEKRITDEAKSIKEKYINPPETTDFAIMYLPIEGLYAEVLKSPALTETLQRDYKVVLCGPTTLTAVLNSLQMGFKTLRIEKRSAELWSLLATFKREFEVFANLLNKTEKKLSEAADTIGDANKRTHTIQKKLNAVSEIEGMPVPSVIEMAAEVISGDSSDSSITPAV